MKSIHHIVPSCIFARTIADSSLPNRHSLSHANHSTKHPSCEQQSQERGRLDVIKQRVAGIVDRIELIIDAVVNILQI